VQATSEFGSFAKNCFERPITSECLDLLIYGTQPNRGCDQSSQSGSDAADFRQVDKVVRQSETLDAIVHLGAIVGDPACALDEELNH